MKKKSCIHCQFLSKRPGAGPFFIYKCGYWGLVTKQVLPMTVVIQSIGKRCPFFIARKSVIEKEVDKKKETGGDDDGDLDITI
jgi:hypothetical protein